MKRTLLAFVLAACSSSAPAPTAPPTPTEPAPPPPEPTADPSAGSGSAAPTEKPNDTPADPAGPGIGENCGPNDSCAAGTECVKYYGIAGPRGPEFKTCEIRCSGKGGTCPAGKNCVTIADGPGSVCR